MGGARHSTTTTDIPLWAKPYTQDLLDLTKSYMTPDGKLLGYDSNLNSQLAGFNPTQTGAMGSMLDTAGAAGAPLGASQQNLTDTLQGKYLDPSSNPWLQSTYNEAAKGMTDAYSTGTAPQLMADAARAGALGGSAYGQQAAMNQYGLGQNLNNLATNLYGGNYAQERQNQMGAQGMVPSLTAAQFMPAQQAMGVGALQQQQTQTGMDVNTQNAMRQLNYPQQMLGFGQQMLAGLEGGQGSTTSPNRAGWLK